MIQHFTKNIDGIDYVSGDIHGEFGKLEDALARIDFNSERDRLFCVGDLVDRGSRSAEALDWLDKPWFHTCRGNHDEFVHTAVYSVDDLSWWVAVNGGDWWLEVDQPLRERFIERFAELPMALEIETDRGLVGLVHADVPAGMRWSDFTAALQAGDRDVYQYALWSRSRAQGMNSAPVEGVVKVYCGHTVFEEVTRVANVCFIDTGSGYDFPDAHLTVLPLDAA